LPCAENFSPNVTSAWSGRTARSLICPITSTVDDATATIAACARSNASPTASCARLSFEVGSEPATGLVSTSNSTSPIRIGTTRPRAGTFDPPDDLLQRAVRAGRGRSQQEVVIEALRE